MTAKVVASKVEATKLELQKTMLWDVPTRIIHWGIALSVILNWFFLEEGDSAHRWVGYFSVGAVLLRFFWGFKGGALSRFSSFPLKAHDFRQFVTDQINGKLTMYPGHNPMATLVYILIWSSVVLLGLTGWLLGLDAFFGNETLEETHKFISIFIQVLIIFHFMGIGLDSWKFKRKTWLGMLRGFRS